MKIYHLKFLLLIFILSFLSAVPSLAQDDVVELIEEGKQAYQKEQYEKAQTLLQKALGQIQNEMSVTFTPFLPAAPSGWEATEAETQSAASTSTSENVYYTETSKKYIRKTDQKSVNIKIGNSPSISQPYISMAKTIDNPMMKKAIEEENNISIKQQGAWYIFHENPHDEYNITALQEGIIVQITGSDSKAVALKFFDNIDLEGIGKVLK